MYVCLYVCMYAGMSVCIYVWYVCMHVPGGCQYSKPWLGLMFGYLMGLQDALLAPLSIQGMKRRTSRWHTYVIAAPHFPLPSAFFLEAWAVAMASLCPAVDDIEIRCCMPQWLLLRLDAVL